MNGEWHPRAGKSDRVSPRLGTFFSVSPESCPGCSPKPWNQRGPVWQRRSRSVALRECVQALQVTASHGSPLSIVTSHLEQVRKFS